MRIEDVGGLDGGEVLLIVTVLGAGRNKFLVSVRQLRVSCKCRAKGANSFERAWMMSMSGYSKRVGGKV